MLTKILNHRGRKQPITFLTEGDTITEDCFHIATFRDNLTYNEMVTNVINDFTQHTQGYATTMAGWKVEEFPERVYYKLE